MIPFFATIVFTYRFSGTLCEQRPNCSQKGKEECSQETRGPKALRAQNGALVAYQSHQKRKRVSLQGELSQEGPVFLRLFHL